jgi:hypothetical protein
VSNRSKQSGDPDYSITSSAVSAIGVRLNGRASNRRVSGSSRSLGLPLSRRHRLQIGGNLEGVMTLHRAIAAIVGLDQNNAVPRRDFLIAAGTAAASGLGVAPKAAAQPAVAGADVILKNGKVITVDPVFTVTSSVAIAGDRILAVGPDEAMAAHTSPATRIVDLKKRPVIPGITDGHAHMDREGLRHVFPSLGRVRSIHDIQDRIAELARGKAPGDWIVTMPIGDPPYYFDVPDSGAAQPSLYPLHLGLLARWTAATRVHGQHRGAQASWNHARYRLTVADADHR